MSYTDLPEIKTLFTLEQQLACLTVYREVAESPSLMDFRRFLIGLCSPGTAVEDSMIHYAEIVSTIIRQDIDGSFPQLIANEIINSINPLSLLLAKGAAAAHPLATSQLSDMAARDLNTLQQLARISSPQIKKLLSSKAWDQKRTDLRDSIASLPIWQNSDTMTVDSSKTDAFNRLSQLFIDELEHHGLWSNILTELISYHQKHGVGRLSGDFAISYRNKQMQRYPMTKQVAMSQMPDLQDVQKRLSFGRPNGNSLLLDPPTVAVDALARLSAQEGIKFIFLQDLLAESLDALIDERLDYNQHYVIVIEHLPMRDLSEADKAFIRRLEVNFSRASDKITFFVSLRLSPQLRRNGTLIDCDMLVAESDPSLHQLIYSFDQLIDCKPPHHSDKDEHPIETEEKD